MGFALKNFSLRRIGYLILIVLLIASFMPLHARAANSREIFVEGEESASTNIRPGIYTGAGYSGGKYLVLFTDTAAPDEGYIAQYQVAAPAAGYYQLDIAATPPNVTWASPFDLKINNGNFERVVNAVEYGQINSTVRNYHLPPVLLKAGMNTITFRVDQRRTSVDQKYTFYIDSFRLTPASLSYEGEAAQTTNILPGIYTGEGYSGGKYLVLFTDTPAPDEGYLAQYQVTVPAAGPYQLDVASTPPNINWASPYEIKVNDDSYKPVTNAVEYSQINSNVRKYHLDPVALKEGVNTITFRVKQRRVQPDAKYTFYLDSFSLTSIPLKLNAVTSTAPLNIFQAGSSEVLSLRLNGPANQDMLIEYSIHDYWSNEVLRKTVSIPPGVGSANVDLQQLPVGNYRITAHLAGDDQSVYGNFALVTPLSERSDLTDSAFAMDTAASWLVPQSKMEDFASALQLSGVKWIRDRFRWNNAVNPASGSFNFAADPADRFIPALSAKGVKILDVFHEAPGWTRPGGGKFPDDLLAAYDFARSSANRYGNQVAAWEVWNEPEYATGYENESADRYAALLKAASIGYYDSMAKPLVSVSGFATLPGNYEEILMENDILSYIDIYNFHRHQNFQAGQPLIPFLDGTDLHQLFLDEHGGSDKPMWISEAGIAIPSQPPAELTWEEQKAQARYLVTSTITSLSQGTDKHFYFVMPPYQEGANYWGMFSRTYTPFASYSAEAAMTEALGEGRYIGAVQGLPDTVTGHSFRDGLDTVLVLWSSTSATVSLQLDQPSIQLTDIMGRKQTVTPNAESAYSLAVGPDPIYARVTGEAFSLPVTRTQSKVSSLSEPTASRTLTAAQHIVMAQTYPHEVRADSRKNGYTLKSDQPTKMKLEIYNFNDMPMTGTIEGRAYGGWMLSEPLRMITLNPHEKTELEFEVAAGSSVIPNEASAITFTGTFNGQLTSRSAAFVRTTKDVQISNIIPGSDNPAAYRLDLPAAISPVGRGQITAGSEPGSVQFDYDFIDGGDRWAYPYLLMPENTDFTGYDGLAFDLYADQDFANSTLRLIIKEKSGARYYTAYGFSMKAGWNQIVVPFADFAFFDGTDPNNQLDLVLTSIQLGINTKTNDLPPFTVNRFGLYKNAMQQDTEAPVTTAALTAVQPNGQNGWYTNPVTIALSATDDLSGLAKSEYSLDGGKMWQLYTVPVTLNEDGSYTLDYRSTDQAGNVEAVQSISFKIDMTVPTATVAYSSGGENEAIAMLTSSEPITITNNGGSPSYTFYYNGSFIFEFVDGAGNKGTASAIVNNLPSASMDKPGKPVLTSNNGYDTGILDGNYNITMDLWWGNNGRIYKLYENDALIDTQILADSTPNAQSTVSAVTYRTNGTYRYYAELTNGYGTTRSDILTVEVTQANPAKPVLSHDNWDENGYFNINMNLWWGTNGTVYRLYENGVMIDNQMLTDASPQAQSAVTAIRDKLPGTYEYRCELVNEAGETSRDVIILQVTK